MTDINQFEWSDFYHEFAIKLLEYKDDRKELIDKIRQVYKEIGIKLPKLEKDNNIVDIDPFTVFGLFNKGISEANRIRIVTKISEVFNLSTKIPQYYHGVPVLNNLNATYYYFLGERDDNDIEALWSLFDNALKYDKEKSTENKENLEKLFDRVIKQKGIGTAKLTMGLYWIATETFINIDSVNQKFIYESNILPKDIVETLPVIKGKISFSDYDKLLSKVREFININDIINSFKEFSYAAWKYSEEMIEQKTIDEGTLKEIESRYNETSYWWLNANPSIWRFQDIEVGSTESYTMYNENGNKRKIFANFLNVKKGDRIIGYETSPEMKIVAVGIINKERDDDRIYFTKTHQLENGITIDEFKLHEGLKNMEFLLNPQGSLFKLEKDEFDIIYNLIESKNPKIEDKDVFNILESDDVKYKEYTRDDFLKEVFIDERRYDRLVNLLLKKKNIILQGAPGVGKTFIAKKLAYSIIGFENDDRVGMVQFHQNYSYEDFVEGFRPSAEGGGFEIKKGTFYNFCIKAASDLENKYLFIIDEINRGNLSKILGELFMLIENDKRGQSLKLAYSDEDFSVPNNLYIIGMMNTADRSLALIDYALRRRFSFFTMEPGFDSEGFKTYQNSLNNEKFNNLINEIQILNREIATDSSLGKGFYIGHSFFCNLESCSDEEIESIIEYELIPLINEYWFDNDSKIEHWASRLYGIINE